MSENEQIKIYADPELASAIDARSAGPHTGGRGLRGGRAEIVRRDLERYYTLLARELRDVNLTEPEAILLVNLSNGTLWEAWSATPLLLAAQVEDADPALLAVDGLDAPALVAKLRALTPGQALAVVDACERWWRTPAEGETTADLLRAVGLLR